MFSGWGDDTDNLVGAIRWERRIHILVFLARMSLLTLFATCGMDAPNPAAPDPIESSWMWLQYTLVISTVVSAITAEIYLLFAYNSFYLFQLLCNVYAVAVIGWNTVSMLIILVTCDSQYPECSLAKFTFIVRFCTTASLFGLTLYAMVNMSNLRSTVNNIRRIRSVLKKSGEFSTESGSRKELAELYNQIRNEQIFHVIVMVSTAVAWGFFAVSEMWITFKNGGDDAWVTFIWWREFAALSTLAPLSMTQLYFLLGGTITRRLTKWFNYIWVIGILPVCAFYFLWIYDQCNKYNLMTLELDHPECGTANILDDSVQPAFIWRICSFFALYVGAALNLVVYNTVTHSLMSLAILKKESRAVANVRGETLEDEEVDEEVGKEKKISSSISKKDRREHHLRHIHHKAYGPSVSQLIHTTNINSLMEEIQEEHPDMLLFQGNSRSGKRK